MVQEAAAPHLSSPIQGRQDSPSSMWPVLALGILTAIVAWIWYRGSGERKEPETPGQKQDTAVTAETGQQNVQSDPSPLDACLASSEQESAQPQRPASSEQESAQPQRPASSEQESAQPQRPASSEQESAQPQRPASSEQESAQPQRPASSEQESAQPQRPASSEQESAQFKSFLDTHQTTGESNLIDADHDPCEYGVPCPKTQEKLLNPDIFPAQNETQRELSDVDPLESNLEAQSNIKAQPDPPLSVQAEVSAADQLSDVSRKVQLQGDLQEHKNEVLPTNIKENPTDPEEDIQEQLTGGTKKEDLHGLLQEPPTKKADQPANILGHQTSAPVVQTNAESCPGMDAHSSEVLHDAGRTLPNGDQGFVLQANEEVVCPTLLAPGAERGFCVPHSASLSDQGSGLGRDPLHQDEVYGKESVNGADGEAENGPGGQLENSFFVKENARNVLESEETSKQDYTIVTDQLFKDESVEKFKGTSKCNDLVKPSTRPQENADVFGSLNTSTSEALCDFQKLGTYSEGSSMEMHSMFNQEKASSNTNEKNSVCCPSEAIINEADHQKTKKVATIQPMPQNVNFGFKVHYITHSDSQIIAVTGDHERLGKWETYIPLTSVNGGFWSRSITLPSDTNVAWKFIMVENGKIKRWEECNNRLLKITHEDIEGQLFWGYPIIQGH
ncbi:starch-binding domain-containing protein 1 [Phyllobates terribilis]|uniref:starch-binding domain-containing protein 1 n=1 Tax=Phyllobates terribilis TaxID=111132 RepID=UPI003CCAEFBF